MRDMKSKTFGESRLQGLGVMDNLFGGLMMA